MAEVHDTPDAPQRLDPPQQRRQCESCKKITGKKRFGNPGWTPSGGVTVTDSGQEHLDLCVLPEIRRGDVLAFGLCLQTEPRRFNLADRIGCVRVGCVNAHVLLTRAGQ